MILERVDAPVTSARLRIGDASQGVGLSCRGMTRIVGWDFLMIVGLRSRTVGLRLGIVLKDFRETESHSQLTYRFWEAIWASFHRAKIVTTGIGALTFSQVTSSV